METPLARWIRAQIESGGPVPFERFMDWALYHPEHGYYTSGRADIGRDEGDFTTSPHLSVVFARCLSRLIEAADRALGSPESFVLAEGGPGEGTFATALLDALAERSPGLYSRLIYALDEKSPALLQRQCKRLAAHRAKLVPFLPDSPFEGVYFSNELVDAFPVHRLARARGKIREVYVTATPAGFRELLLAPSRAALLEHLEDGVEIAEGCQAEVNPNAERWMAEVARRLARGYVITVDYGDEAARLYGTHSPRGTCVAYRSHRLVKDLFEDPGLQDLTAHVNFSTLRRVGTRLELLGAPLLRQREFLFAIGLAQEWAELESRAESELERIQLRQSLAPLLLPGGMGDRFKALVQAKRAPLSELPLDPDVAFSLPGGSGHPRRTPG